MLIDLQILLEISNFFLACQPASPQKNLRAEQVRAAGYAGWPKIAASRAEVRVGLSPTTSLLSNKVLVELGNESASKRNFLKISSVVGSFPHVICWWPRTIGKKQKPRKESVSK